KLSFDAVEVGFRSLQLLSRSICVAPQCLAPRAVSVDAHYREPKLLHKIFFIEKRSLAAFFHKPTKHAAFTANLRCFFG
ncbi:hypothetical protein KJI95_19240, partial [Shewanella sp. JM162201]